VTQRLFAVIAGLDPAIVTGGAAHPVTIRGSSPRMTERWKDDWRVGSRPYAAASIGSTRAWLAAFSTAFCSFSKARTSIWRMRSRDTA